MDSQRYISIELTHFVGRSLLTDEARYRLLVKILKEGKLKAPGYNQLTISLKKSVSQNEMFKLAVVCFCDIPVADLGNHIGKYGAFGLSFLKPFLIMKGANPVFYIAANSIVNKAGGDFAYWWTDESAVEPPIRTGTAGAGTIKRSEYFDKMLQEYEALFRTFMRQESQRDFEKVRHLQRFLSFYVFSYLEPFDDSLTDDHPDNFYMEREWRILGHVDFSMSDVHRVILPQSFSGRFRRDLSEYVGQISFP